MCRDCETLITGRRKGDDHGVAQDAGNVGNILLHIVWAITADEDGSA